MRIIPDQVSPTTKSQAERRLFTLLSDIEDTDWYYALHSLNLSEHVWKRMGEIDFLLVGPRGVYVIEVKGGQVAHRNGVWEFTDRYGTVRRKREGPFEQARSAMFSLEKALARALDGNDPFRVVFGYGVALPDCDLSTQSVEWAPETVIDRQQLDRRDGIQRALGRLAYYWKSKPGGRKDRVSPELAERILAALRPDFDTVPTLRQVASATEVELVSLTTAQYRALDSHARNPRVVFEGGAGTGKTMLAAEVCRRRSVDSPSVLFTCRSGILAGFVASQPGLEGVDVVPFERLRRGGEKRYSMVVADEAQDLINYDDLGVLDGVIDGGLENGRWLLFMDSNNQRGLAGSYDQSASEFLLSARPALVTLTDNCRNTRQIVTRTQELTGADVGVSSAGNGPEVTVVQVGSPGEGALSVTAHLDALDEQGINPSELVLLSSEPLEKSIFSKLPQRWLRRIQPLDLHRMRRAPRGQIGFARTGEFKGLESSFILLDRVLGRGQETDRPHLYVGMTRARVGLWIVSDRRLDTTALVAGNNDRIGS
ncbi:NERD domain-containing protein [Polymorphospora rubra]|uniref:nuclease-related domain-containing DEAD/DEAH box helicase n=1 Tax=Polymorphospora rubra TaxID=338584 RepID=UPI0033E17621